MPPTHVKAKTLLLLTALFLPACEDMFVKEAPPRNFDELIPRLLGSVKNRTPEEAAVSLFNATSPDERRDAVAYLETKPFGHNPPYMKVYEIMADQDPNPMVRAQAMEALGSSYQAEAVDYLVRGLANPDVQVRRDAAMALTKTWGDAALTPLTKHLISSDEPDATVRINAARALYHYNTPETVRALITALEDKNAAVTYYAHLSLVTITSQDLGFDARAWLTWYQQTYTAPATQPSP